jgi:hypothetical protein
MKTIRGISYSNAGRLSGDNVKDTMKAIVIMVAHTYKQMQDNLNQNDYQYRVITDDIRLSLKLLSSITPDPNTVFEQLMKFYNMLANTYNRIVDKLGEDDSVGYIGGLIAGEIEWSLREFDKAFSVIYYYN